MKKKVKLTSENTKINRGYSSNYQVTLNFPDLKAHLDNLNYMDENFLHMFNHVVYPWLIKLDSRLGKIEKMLKNTKTTSNKTDKK